MLRKQYSPYVKQISTSWKYGHFENRQGTCSNAKRCDARVFLHSSIWFYLLEKLLVQVWYRAIGPVYFRPAWLVLWCPYPVMRWFKCPSSLRKLHGYTGRLSRDNVASKEHIPKKIPRSHCKQFVQQLLDFVISMIAFFWIPCVKVNTITVLHTLSVVGQVFLDCYVISYALYHSVYSGSCGWKLYWIGPLSRCFDFY